MLFKKKKHLVNKSGIKLIYQTYCEISECNEAIIRTDLRRSWYVFVRQHIRK